eukprot:UN06384
MIITQLLLNEDHDMIRNGSLNIVSTLLKYQNFLK